MIVGGGPAGSACAADLVRAGRDVLVLDKASFPRLKLCAGWITPEVVRDLALDVSRYPHRFNVFSPLLVHAKGLNFKLKGPQYSIRRYEFDAYLLERSGAPVQQHDVRRIERQGDGFLIDGTYRCRYLVGAGGTRCPVYRSLFRELNPRARYLQAVTLEHEFECRVDDMRCHLWFLDHGLPGYAWYVPKADGYLNCGLGAMSAQLKRNPHDLRWHWQRFAERLAATGLLDSLETDVSGYSYYLRGNVDSVRAGNALIAGDAAGLATRDLCEGIGPAIASGQRAARSILTGTTYDLADISAYSSDSRLARGLLEHLFVGRSRRAARSTSVGTA
ncbi:MAG: NAD(P)/FAD-dependent oxidoreductase [Gammaproteobacteria bacterium]|nr:NAD(P)/FAD-dependent oxidoreductase [Gammaproteobacteria bacterium]